MKSITGLVFGVLSLTASAATVSTPLNIGVAAAVRGAVKAVAPGAAGRVVETGKPVYSHDKVTTGPEGKLQILLLDQTSFTIGANSEMELDEFVFDPATNIGKVAAKITKGAFRFVTGKVARRDPSSMSVATPVGTIGIRGTMTAGNVSESEATIVLLGPGPENNADEKQGGITVKNAQGSTDIDKDGWGVTVKAGQAPSKPFELGGNQIEGILSSVGSAPKGDQKDEASDGKSADSSSGQGTAAGKAKASDAFAAIDAAQGEAGRFASQQFSAPSDTTWEKVVAIPGGQGKYSGSASYFACTGSSCGGAPAGTMDFTLAIDFAAKTVGGGSSSISLAGASGASGSIQSFSYAGQTGAATYVPTIPGIPDWTGTTISLINAGGVTAGAAAIDVHVLNTSGPNPSTTYGGSLTGLRAP